MIRFIYAILSRLGFPIFFIYLLYRGVNEPAYRARKRERFGFAPLNIATGKLWFHTVSAGEAIAAIPIIDTVMREHENERVFVTTTTPSGYEAIKSHFGSRVDHCYIPYDIPSCVNRFLKRTKPKALFLMETELWPNLINRTSKYGAPVYLINARLSDKSAKGYARLADLNQSMMNNIRSIACQYQDSADRFRQLGYPEERLVVTGSVKFDITEPHIHELPDFLKNIESVKEDGTLIWIAGSTHAPEEEVVLTAHKSVLNAVPNSKLILAPRHITRVDEILSLCTDLKLEADAFSRCTDQKSDVLILDQMGILFVLYQYASVAFVGGSLQHTGGHNPIEPAYHGLPVLMGPNRRNFAEVCAKFEEQDCLFTVSNAKEIAERVLHFHGDQDALAQCSDRTRTVVRANKGALARVCSLLNSWLDELSPSSPN